MDELQRVIEATKTLARLGCTEDEIAVLKQYCRETRPEGMSFTDTIEAVAGALKGNPRGKSELMAQASKPLEHRQQEIEVLRFVIPKLKEAAKYYPDPIALAEFQAAVHEHIAELFPEANAHDISSAIEEQTLDGGPGRGWGLRVSFVLDRLREKRVS
jgi:hypothetical protein